MVGAVLLTDPRVFVMHVKPPPMFLFPGVAQKGHNAPLGAKIVISKTKVMQNEHILPTRSSRCVN